MPPQRFSSSAGFAIGPILFVLAMLAVLGAVIASGSTNFQLSSTIDRITADITAQANMIRNTINNCNLQYQMALSTGSVSLVETDPPGGYPESNTTSGTAISALACDPMGTSSLWGAIMMPPPTKGFTPWMYMNNGSKGRCIWTEPLAADPKNDTAIVQGLTRAASKFNTSISVSLLHEVIYNPSSDSQRFVVWITLPETVGEADSHCSP
ncbi:MAG: hypothetical protein WC464_01420 [Bdellovibrionales bacterium]